MSLSKRKNTRQKQQKQAKPIEPEEDEDELDSELHREQSEEEDEDILKQLGLSNNPQSKKNKQSVILQSAWQDEDDNNLTVNISNVARLRKLRKTEEEDIISGIEYQERLKSFYQQKIYTDTFHTWSQIKDKPILISDPQQQQYNQSSSNTLELEKLLAQNYSVVKDINLRESLPEKIIRITKQCQQSQQDKHNSIIQTIQFHQNSEIFLSAGYDKVVKLFQIRRDNEEITLQRIKTLYMKGLPINNARFNVELDEIIISGLKRHLLCYNMQNDKIEKISSNLFTNRFEKPELKFTLSPNDQYICIYGEGGYIIILHGKTKQKLFEFKMNERCNDVQFTPDNRYIFSCGDNGRIYQWDLNTRKVFDNFMDVGSLCTEHICISNNNVYIATGTSSGIVNIYNYDSSLHLVNKTPIKEITNLTTKISGLQFNSTNEILAYSSKWKPNAIKLMHFPSLTTFSNWPNFKTKLKLISAFDISPNSKYLALGNENGNLFLYNFEHYS